jgi:hypothetical protein
MTKAEIMHDLSIQLDEYFELGDDYNLGNTPDFLGFAVESMVNYGPNPPEGFDLMDHIPTGDAEWAQFCDTGDWSRWGRITGRGGRTKG